MMLNPKVKAAGGWMLSAFVALIVWCALMLSYAKLYDLIERSTLPVTLASKTFQTNTWEDGYFSAKGSFENQSAIQAGDELPLQTNVVTCVKADKTCTVATADVFDQYLDLDVSYFDITSWTNQEITFTDDSPICLTNFYVIDRASQTLTLIVRKRAVIPDYALQSPLHPCDNIKDKTINLSDGFKLYWRKKTEFEARNGIYFHLVLVAINVFFVVALVWLWRKRKASIHDHMDPKSDTGASGVIDAPESAVSKKMGDV